MNKVYVAGKTQAVDEVRAVQALCRRNGYTITHDWTKVMEEVGGPADEVNIDPQIQAECAQADKVGVYSADLVIACAHPRLCGTLIEVGMALAWNVPVWLVGNFTQHSVFFAMPNVERHTMATLGARLWQLSTRRLEMEAATPTVIPYATEEEHDD